MVSKIREIVQFLPRITSPSRMRGNWTLAGRIYLLLAPVAVMGVILGWTSWLSLAGKNNDAHHGLARATKLKDLSLGMEIVLLVQENASKELILDPESTRANSIKIDAYDTSVKLAQEILGISPSKQIRTLLEQAQQIDDQELKDMDMQLLEASAGGDLAKAKEVFFKRYMPVRLRYDALISNLSRQAELEYQQADRDVTAWNKLLFEKICATVLAGLLVLCGSIVVLQKSVRRTLRELFSELVNRSYHARSSGKRLEQVSHSLRNSSGKTEQEMASGAKDLAAVITGFEQNREKTQNALETVQEAERIADQAQIAMRQMVDQLDEIDRAARVMKESSKLIEQIALRTRIVSLNASVEAARAAEHGKGFAVVAEEVRALANQSGEVAAEVTVRIEGINQITKNLKTANLAVEENLSGIIERSQALGQGMRSIANAIGSQTGDVTNLRLQYGGLSDLARVSASQSANGEAAAASVQEEIDLLGESIRRFALNLSGDEIDVNLESTL